MKSFYLIAIAAVASASAIAQTPMPSPTGAAPRTTQESNAAKSGGMAADTAQSKTDAKSMGTGPSANWKTMDANGDGMISQEEYMAYHGGMWKKMKMTKGKMVSVDDMQKNMASGPN
ncbi:MAG: hypothetical protein ABIR26_19605 [Ramlibacter sp.]